MKDIKRILHPTDFSDVSRYALPYALSFAKRFSAELSILHVLELPYGALSQASEAIGTAKAKFRDLIPPDSSSGIEIVRIVKRGRPSSEICDTAEEIEADLIILATHGHSGLEHAILGSTAERVVRHAPCPVLTVRLPMHGADGA